MSAPANSSSGRSHRPPRTLILAAPACVYLTLAGAPEHGWGEAALGGGLVGLAVLAVPGLSRAAGKAASSSTRKTRKGEQGKDGKR